VPAAAMEINDSPIPQEPIIWAPIMVAVARSPAGPVDNLVEPTAPRPTSPPMLIFKSAFILVLALGEPLLGVGVLQEP